MSEAPEWITRFRRDLLQQEADRHDGFDARNIGTILLRKIQGRQPDFRPHEPTVLDQLKEAHDRVSAQMTLEQPSADPNILDELHEANKRVLHASRDERSK